MTTPVLLIEDDDALRASLAQTIDLEGIDVIATASYEQAKRLIRANFAGVVLSDITMPHKTGFDVLGLAQSIDPDLPVILLTGHGDVPTALRAMKEGAHDFLEKPCATDHLIEVLNRARNHRALVLKNRRMEQQLRRSDPAAINFPGSAPLTRQLRSSLRMIAQATTPAHLVGPMGVGKRLAAHTIHRLIQDDGQFFTLDFNQTSDPNAPGDLLLADLPLGDLVLFAKNIDAASPSHMHALLDLCQSRANLRLITASDVSISDLSQRAGQTDFWSLLNPTQLNMPSMKDRKKDIIVIFEDILRQVARNNHIDVPQIPRETRAYLMAQDWPGNFPELRSFAKQFAASHASGSSAPVEQSLADQMHSFERMVLEETLKRTNGRATQAAKQLDLPRKTFYDRLARHGLRPKDFQS